MTISDKKENLQMNPKIFVGYILAFVSGLTLGALTALLLAPTTGEELRSQIQLKADASSEQIKANYDQARQWVTDETGKLRKGKQAGEDAENQ
jgi:gas vesicle protein